MRQLRAFRPRISEAALEARAVPTTLGVVIPTGVFGLNVTLPQQVQAGSPKVQAAFATFDQSYIRAVDTILLAPDVNGLVVPSSNLASFNAAVEKSLETLAQQLVLSLSTTGSTTSSVSDQVSSAIVGSSPTSLESELQAISIANIELNLANVTSVSTPTTPTLVPNVVTTAEQVRPTTRVPVAEATGASTFLSDSSTLSTPSTTKAANDVRSAFGNFLNDYFQAVRGTLLAPSTAGQVNPAANRAAFDAKVNQAIQTLETRLSTTLTRYPATSGLGPQIQAALEGNDASSLKNQLGTLPTPAGSQASLVRSFTLGSTQAIAQALSLISGEVSTVLNPPGQ
jgi:hypothetical protein